MLKQVVTRNDSGEEIKCAEFTLVLRYKNIRDVAKKFIGLESKKSKDINANIDKIRDYMNIFTSKSLHVILISMYGEFVKEKEFMSYDDFLHNFCIKSERDGKMFNFEFLVPYELITYATKSLKENAVPGEILDFFIKNDNDLIDNFIHDELSNSFKEEVEMHMEQAMANKKF